MRKILGIVVLFLLMSTSAYTDDIKDFHIENISIGDSALDYFTEDQIENSELDWFNYSHKEYSTSLVAGKGIYDWFLISYKSDDDNFIIEGLAGILVKKKYDDYKCNKELDTVALDISELFKNTKQGKKQLYKVIYNPRKIFQKPDPSGKSIVTSISFDFKDGGKIILSCYNMDKEANKNSNFMMSILNKKDSFRIEVRSHIFVNYLKKGK